MNIKKSHHRSVSISGEIVEGKHKQYEFKSGDAMQKMGHSISCPVDFSLKDSSCNEQSS